MIQWLDRITISDKVAEMLAEDKLDEVVDFTFINKRTDKETTRQFRLEDAIRLAEYRRNDRRYKNFEFHIGPSTAQPINK